MKHILETDIPEVSEHEILEEERYIISLIVSDNQPSED